MAFVKYKVADNAYSTLLVGISAGATSLQTQASEGARFPASNFVATIVQYTTLGDETSAVVKREKVLVSNNATDTFTITRGFDGDTPVAFNAGDFIYLNNVSAITEDIQDEVTRLETAKLNLGALRTGLAAAWRFFFSNGSGAETAIAFGVSGTVLTSNGVSSAPSFEAPSVSITLLTEDTVWDMDADYFIKNNWVWLNTKILLKRYRATSAEIIAGASNIKFVTPSQIAATVWVSDMKLAQSLSSVDTTTSYVKAKEAVATVWGTYRTVFTLNWRSTSDGFSLSVYGRIYKNGSAFWTEQIFTTSTGSFTTSQTYTEDLTFATGDLIQLYIKYANNKTIASCSDFYVKGSYFPTSILPTINL